MIIVIEFDSLLSNFLEDLAHYFIEVKWSSTIVFIKLGMIRHSKFVII